LSSQAWSWISIIAMALASLSPDLHAWFRTTALGSTMRVAASVPKRR